MCVTVVLLLVGLCALPVQAGTPMQNAIRRLSQLNYSKVKGKWPLSEERCLYVDTIPSTEEFYRKYVCTPAH
jgi:hypothetical protein